MTTSYFERVAAGAAWLDEHRPGWVDRVDPVTLDLGDECHCVLGQEYGNAFRAPGEAVYGPVSPAFFADDELEMVSDEVQFEALTEEWRRLILERRAAA